MGAKLFFIETIKTHFAKERSFTHAGIGGCLLNAAVKCLELLDQVGLFLFSDPLHEGYAGWIVWSDYLRQWSLIRKVHLLNYR